MAGAVGLEPTTSSLENCCSIRLSYTPGKMTEGIFSGDRGDVEPESGTSARKTDGSKVVGEQTRTLFADGEFR